jgi:hypothetical protein
MDNHDIRLIEELVGQVQAIPDAQARGLTIELLRAVMDFHAAGIERMLAIAGDSRDAIAADDLCSALLLLHGLHPDSIETRIARALERLQLRLGSRGATISLVRIEDGAVHLRYDGTSSRSAAGVRENVEQFLYSAAPELESITIEGLREPSDGFVPLEQLAGGIGR